MGGALTTEAMDSGKSATESLSTTESIYKVKRNKGTKEHHQNIEVYHTLPTNVIYIYLEPAKFFMSATITEALTLCSSLFKAIFQKPMQHC